MHTQNAAREMVTSLLISGERIVARGTESSIMAWEGTATRVVDLQGRVVLPGLIDAHTHPVHFAPMREQCKLGAEPLTA